ncbi:hypothetical protein H4R34_004446 [Dimargaris verticillata]|uniref:Endonuclease/exonuclease/phosphatase domain-containing protein n=1 Tax=Dimargaris verticillata TaxID=2761393 RepID=A0A9W8B5J4_9FUNG|nr:hypothetical protein H4R34_004446 [Dimargaris verticillata]
MVPEPRPAIVPGQVVHFDARPKLSLATATTDSPLKVMQWNIERGYQLDAIVTILKREAPDIAILQELDIHCERSNYTDQLRAISEAMAWNGGFVAEFEEIHSPLRAPETQGGGFHGNAIFSRFDMTFRIIDHQYQPVNWNRDGIHYLEPRRGQRYSLVAIIQPGPAVPPIMAYSVHLEVFCGLSHRICQFAELLDDAYRHKAQYPHQLLFGDLNTMAHSIARLSPRYACDSFRWRSLGRSEPQWWQTNVLSCYRDSVSTLSAQANGDEKCHDVRVNQTANPNLQRYGPHVFPPDVVAKALNPGFTEPWDLHKDVTLENHCGLLRGKLDWTLTMGFRWVSKAIGNHDYHASDHKYLVLTVQYA